MVQAALAFQLWVKTESALEYSKLVGTSLPPVVSFRLELKMNLLYIAGPRSLFWRLVM